MSGDKLRLHNASMDFQIYRTERSLGFPEVHIPHPGTKKEKEPPILDDLDYRVARSTSGFPELEAVKSAADAGRTEDYSLAWRRLTQSEWISAAEISEFLYVWGTDAVAVEDEPEAPKNKGKRRGRPARTEERKPGTTWEEGVFERGMVELRMLLLPLFRVRTVRMG